jgi:hypothetical protein
MSGTHFAYAAIDKARIAGASVDPARLGETGSVISNADPIIIAKQERRARGASGGQAHRTSIAPAHLEKPFGRWKMPTAVWASWLGSCRPLAVAAVVRDDVETSMVKSAETNADLILRSIAKRCVSKDGCNARTRGHPSRRAYRRRKSAADTRSSP